MKQTDIFRQMARLVSFAYVRAVKSDGVEDHDHGDEAALRDRGRRNRGRSRRNDDRHDAAQRQLVTSHLKMFGKELLWIKFWRKFWRNETAKLEKRV